MASQRSSTVSGRDHFEEGLEFREGHLDWIEVGTIRWQEAPLGASGVDGLADGDGLVSRQIVHDDNVAGFQRRHQHLFHIGQEGAAVHGAAQGVVDAEPIRVDDAVRTDFVFNDRP